MKKKQDIVGWCSNPADYGKLVPYINWIQWPNSDNNFRESLLQELIASETPLALISAPIHLVPFFAKRGLLRSMNGIIPENIIARQDSRLLKLCSSGENLFAIPEDIQVYAFTSRTDSLINTPPSTWGDLEKLAGENRGSILSMARGGINSRMGFFFSLLLSGGVNFNYDTFSAVNNISRVTEAYEWLRRFANEAKAFETEALIRTLEINTIEDFVSGKTRLWAGWIGPQTGWPAEKQKPLHLFPFPRRSLMEKKRTAVRGRAWCIPNNTLHMVEAKKALNFLQKPELVRNREIEGGHGFPAWKSLWLDRELTEKRPLCRFAEELITGELYCLDVFDDKWKLLEEVLRTALSEDLPAERLSSRLRGKETFSSRRTVRHSGIIKALEYIEKNIGSIQSVLEIAEAAGMSRTHLNVLFKKELKVTAGDYLDRRRMERAKELLKNGNESIKAISFTLGFRSQSYFGKLFRRCWGVSATSFRKLKKT
jgi:AraC-like DNA-binding protein